MIRKPARGETLADVATGPLLEVQDLKVHFPFTRGNPFWPERGAVRAVDGVSFSLQPGQTLGLVGESGCGKSTTARAIVNLVRATSGEVRIDGERTDDLSSAAMHPYRRRVQMIFQDPFASLNPRMTIGSIIAEPMAVFGLHPYRERKFEVMRLLDRVGLNPRFLNRYPHESRAADRHRPGARRQARFDHLR